MVFEKIKSLLSKQLNLDPARIKMESDIIADLGADSLDVVEMLMTLEDNFKVTVPDDKASELKTIGQLVAFIESQIK